LDKYGRIVDRFLALEFSVVLSITDPYKLSIMIQVFNRRDGEWYPIWNYNETNNYPISMELLEKIQD